MVEKALGSIAKSGKSAIVEVLSPGQRPTKRGPFTPQPRQRFCLRHPAGSLWHHGAGIHHRSRYAVRADGGTGDKMATRTELANRWYDLMDINAGTIATGEETIEDVGRKLFEFILDVASGRKNLLRSMGPAQPAGGI